MAKFYQRGLDGIRVYVPYYYYVYAWESISIGRPIAGFSMNLYGKLSFFLSLRTVR